MTAGARLEAAYRAQLVADGLLVDTPCAVCGGGLFWAPACVVAELVDPVTVGEILLDVMHHGGGFDTPVAVCWSCQTCAVWCTGTHGVDEDDPRALAQIAALVDADRIVRRGEKR